MRIVEKIGYIIILTLLTSIIERKKDIVLNKKYNLLKEKNKNKLIKNNK